MMQGLAWLPLSWLRGLGWLLGLFLYAIASPRRRVARINLGLCFPDLSPSELRTLTRRSFVRFAQAWLDRTWLWHGRPAVVFERLHLMGDVEQFVGEAPLVIFAPHFVGLDAGWTALTQQIQRRFTTIYTRAAQPGLDAWMQAGRRRFGGGRLFARIDAAKPVLAALRAGEPLYLLPDMNFDVIALCPTGARPGGAGADPNDARWL
jgi:KDO2-lipid IV(A) lauroyltransferase